MIDDLGKFYSVVTRTVCGKTTKNVALASLPKDIWYTEKKISKGTYQISVSEENAQMLESAIKKAQKVVDKFMLLSPLM